MVWYSAKQMRLLVCVHCQKKTVLVLVIFEIRNIYLQQPMLNEVRERDREREGEREREREREIERDRETGRETERGERERQ